MMNFYSQSIQLSNLVSIICSVFGLAVDILSDKKKFCLCRHMWSGSHSGAKFKLLNVSVIWEAEKSVVRENVRQSQLLFVALL